MNLSLCCISNILAEQGIKFRKITFKSFSSLPKEEGLKKISEITIHNLNVTKKTILHCLTIGISGYRMSSDIVPLITHPDINLKIENLPEQDLINNAFAELSDIISKNKIRISAHPSEYISLTNDNQNTLTNTINDLELHGAIFDKLNLPCNYLSPLNIHIRKDGNEEDLYNKFMNNFKKLSNSVRNRLVLENNDNAKGTWSIKKLIKIFFERENIPITYDNLHHQLLPDYLSEEEAFNMAFKTWNCQPLFHYSEGRDGTKAHAEMPKSKPNNFGKDVMFDVELKGKDLAIIEIINMLKSLY
jgi:UV DNA damage endonuclease